MNIITCGSCFHAATQQYMLALVDRAILAPTLSDLWIPADKPAGLLIQLPHLSRIDKVRCKSYKILFL